MVIVEGPDGAGKSTLVERLSNHLGIEPSPRACTSEGGPVDHLAEWTIEDLHRRLSDPHSVTLHDRHPLISEPIYGPLVRGHLIEGYDNVEWYSGAWRMFKACRPIVIVCLPSIETVVANVNRDSTPQMDGVKFNITQIYGLYHNYVARERAYDPATTGVWNYEAQDADDVWDGIAATLTLDKLRRKNEHYGH